MDVEAFRDIGEGDDVLEASNVLFDAASGVAYDSVDNGDCDSESMDGVTTLFEGVAEGEGGPGVDDGIGEWEWTMGDEAGDIDDVSFEKLVGDCTLVSWCTIIIVSWLAPYAPGTTDRRITNTKTG